MGLFKNIAQKDLNPEALRKAKEEQDFFSGGKIDGLSLWNLGLDIILKIICLFFLFWVIHFNLCHIYAIIREQYVLSKLQKLDPLVLQALIKYGLSYNGLLLIVLGYWFGKDGGFMKSFHQLREYFRRSKEKSDLP